MPDYGQSKPPGKELPGGFFMATNNFFITGSLAHLSKEEIERLQMVLDTTGPRPMFVPPKSGMQELTVKVSPEKLYNPIGNRCGKTPNFKAIYQRLIADHKRRHNKAIITAVDAAAPKARI